jgi:hypothetical protein
MYRIGRSERRRIADRTCALVCYLYGDVSTSAGDQVDVALHRQHLDVSVS